MAAAAAVATAAATADVVAITGGRLRTTPITAVGLALPCPPPITDSGRPMSLVQVQIAFRHGARTPVNDSGGRDERGERVQWLREECDKAELLQSFGQLRLLRPGSGEKIDPLAMFPPEAQPQGLPGGAQAGQLTRVGLLQAVKLGQELRSRYVDASAKTSAEVRRGCLLPCSWADAQTLVATRSTRVERTVYTAQGVLAGLFPQNSADGSLIAEIYLNTNSASDRAEWMVLNEGGCPRMRQLFHQGLALSTANLDAAQEEVLERIEKQTAWRAGAPEWRLIAYRDWQACRRAAGKSIPLAVEEIAAELDLSATKQMHSIFEGGARHTDTPGETRAETVRLSIGRMMAHIVESMGRPDGKLHLYSGHDWTLSPLLLCVAKPDDPLFHSWPPFCSNGKE